MMNFQLTFVFLLDITLKIINMLYIIVQQHLDHKNNYSSVTSLNLSAVFIKKTNLIPIEILPPSKMYHNAYCFMFLYTRMFVLIQYKKKTTPLYGLIRTIFLVII